MSMNDAAPLLQVRGLVVRYHGNVAVDALDFALNRGEVVALIGANGAGKSSVMKALMGVVPSSSKEMGLDGIALGKLPTRERIKAGIALSPEGRAVFPELSVKKNLELGYLDSNAALGRTRCDEIFQLFPKLQQRVDQLAGTMSGGEQQMLAIGRALMAGPKVLLLDEPTLGLAPIIVKEIATFVRRVADGGVSVILSEQNASMALTVSDRAYVLATGKSVMSGASSQLMENGDIRKAYLGI